MNKLKEIYYGWKYYLFPPKISIQNLFSDRLAICNICEYNLCGICQACGCVIKAKTQSPTTLCPENKWQPIVYEYQGVEFIKLTDLEAPLAELAATYPKVEVPDLDSEAIKLEDWTNLLKEQAKL